MSKDLVALYEEVLRRCQEVLGLPDLAATRSRLYTLLLHKPLDPRLARVLDELSLSASYVRTHLLSIGSWPDEVRDAMRVGLPYQDARRVAQLDGVARREVLDVFHARGNVRGAALAREHERRLQHQRAAEQLPLTRDGWVPPTSRPGREPRPLSATLIYRSAEVAAGAEALPRTAAEGLLAAYTSPGGRVIDPMAGAGTMAVAAHAVGRWSWSGDVRPRHHFIHRLDASDAGSWWQTQIVHQHRADLVLVHPPSLAAWLSERDQVVPEAYEGWIARLIENAVSVACPGGYVAAIVRPHRAKEGVTLIMDVAQRGLREAGTTVIGYHLLVEDRGDGEWHVLVGRRES